MARRTNSLAKRARSARELDVADAVYALVRDNLAARVPGVKPRRSGPDPRRLALAAGALGAVIGVAALSRKKVAGLLGGGGESTSAPAPAPAESPSNYDSPTPPTDEVVAAGTIPEPIIDEQAEEAAAAEEAGSIGGHVGYGSGVEPLPEPEDRTDGAGGDGLSGSATQPDRTDDGA